MGLPEAYSHLPLAPGSPLDFQLCCDSGFHMHFVLELDCEQFHDPMILRIHPQM